MHLSLFRLLLSPSRRLTGAAIILLMALGTLNTGCKKALEKDVTSDPKYGDFFAVVGKWRAKIPLKIVEVNKHLHLRPKDGVDYGGDRVVLTLPVGTEIRIDRLMYREVMGGTPFYPLGSIVSGAYAGKPIELDDQLFHPNPFNDPNVSKPPPDFTFKWKVSTDVLTR